jgi:hypothetical protein
MIAATIAATIVAAIAAGGAAGGAVITAIEAGRCPCGLPAQRGHQLGRQLITPAQPYSLLAQFICYSFGWFSRDFPQGCRRGFHRSFRRRDQHRILGACHRCIRRPIGVRITRQILR